MNNSEFQAHTEQIERLVQRVAEVKDENARNAAIDLLQSLMDLHGAAMARIVELLSDSGDAGRSSLAKIGSDPLICGMLVLYGIHPVVLEDRVRRAIEEVRPKLQKHGGTVELIGIADAVVRVKIQSSGNGCSSSPEKLKLAVEQAILEAAPEVKIVTDGVPDSAFVPLTTLQSASKKDNLYEESTA
jgi:Fe-S cluster biogenesis protein NfuA